MRRTRPLHECHGGVEIPQTESALVRVLNAIDVVIVDYDKTTNDNRSPVRQTRLAELTHACWLESASLPSWTPTFSPLLGLILFTHVLSVRREAAMAERSVRGPGQRVVSVLDALVLFWVFFVGLVCFASLTFPFDPVVHNNKTSTAQ